MKKTISIILATILALTAIFVLTSVAFAEGSNILNSGDDTTTATTATTTNVTTTENIADALSKLSDTIDNMTSSTKIPVSATTDNAEVVTNPDGVTAIDEGTSATTAAKEVKSTKAAAAVTSYVPNTGSNAAVGIVALLALAGGACAVVVTKKKEG